MWWEMYLATPAKANNRPLFNAAGLAQLLYDFGDAWQCLGRRGLRLEELAQLRAFLFVVTWWVPRDVCGFAFEEVGHEDLVGVVFVRVGEDIGALEGLIEEAEDVVDDEDALFGRFGARGVWEGKLDVGMATWWFCGIYKSLGRRLQCSLLWVSSLC
jgi:hypothetical protein